MKESEVRERAFAMPLTSPAYPIGPYRFCNREYLIITYRTEPQKLRELVPEPLKVEESVVKFEFIRLPDSTGFGDYSESGQVIPVCFRGSKGGYTHCMFLNDHPPIAGRELSGFPKKLEYHLEDIDLKGAWTGPGQLTLFSHALAPLTELPVLEIVYATHIIADLTLGFGKVVHDYVG